MLIFRCCTKSRNIVCCQPYVTVGGKYIGKPAQKFSTMLKMRQSAVAEEAIKIPHSETIPQNEKTYSSKITTIVDQISALNLLEVSDLNELLKSRLKIR